MNVDEETNLVCAMQNSAWDVGLDNALFASADVNAAEDLIMARALRASAQEAWEAEHHGAVEQWSGLVDTHEHRLRRDVRERHTCDICGDGGTAFRCEAGCDFDVCEVCWTKQGVRVDSSAPGLDAAEVEANAGQLVDMGLAPSRESAVEILATVGGDTERAVALLLARCNA
jgi:hypothetical protein